MFSFFDKKENLNFLSTDNDNGILKEWKKDNRFGIVSFIFLRY